MQPATYSTPSPCSSIFVHDKRYLLPWRAKERASCFLRCNASPQLPLGHNVVHFVQQIDVWHSSSKEGHSGVWSQRGHDHLEVLRTHPFFKALNASPSEDSHFAGGGLGPTYPSWFRGIGDDKSPMPPMNSQIRASFTRRTT